MANSVDVFRVRSERTTAHAFSGDFFVAPKCRFSSLNRFVRNDEIAEGGGWEVPENGGSTKTSPSERRKQKRVDPRSKIVYFDASTDDHPRPPPTRNTEFAPKQKRTKNGINEQPPTRTGGQTENVAPSEISAMPLYSVYVVTTTTTTTTGDGDACIYVHREHFSCMPR